MIRAVAARPVLSALVGINVLVALVASAWIVAADGFTWISVLLDGVGPVQLAAEMHGPTVDDGEVWRLVTASFVHYGVLHLLANLAMLTLAGWWLEPWMGSLRFALLYGVSVLASGAASYIVFHDSLTAGASGAIFGLLGALLVLAVRRGQHVLLAIGLLLFGAVTTFAIPGMAIAAHAGGLLVGLVGGGLVVARRDGERAKRPVGAAAAPAGRR